mmetsp:Transcript_77378/g.149457  ORF Transcript_77378/g.149457 Transcript_77378/m.149457 type:complete len:161 (-) Transcript_77378:8-490(-)|eukprot:CAMPEP_0172723796 /NCGR_PEP_ID=MMETSP1074-20121228/84514_1 /TAXON_ID=2916 /ORGANISM="Ceratium fusus, Strain PA161109" /LENGTH=160 /DNA_ID=CAMNT_0013550099 /DNA_START=57 /DNA_END=539 /DNA_ORIENTATION=+
MAEKAAHSEEQAFPRWSRRARETARSATSSLVQTVDNGTAVDAVGMSWLEPTVTDVDLPMQTREPASDNMQLGTQKHVPNDPCPVCLEGFGKSDERGLPRTCRRCGNSFHQACLSEWAKKEQHLKWEQKPWMLPSQFESGSCPCCRSSKGHDRSRRWTKK